MGETEPAEMSSVPCNSAKHAHAHAHTHMHTHLSTLLVHPPKVIGPSPGTVAPAGVMLAAVLM